MPKPAPERKISVTVNYRGWITLLNVMGPVVHPIAVTEKKALQLVMMGLDVTEHVKKTGMTIKLTLDNIRDPNRYAVADSNAVHVEKKKGVPNLKANPQIDKKPEWTPPKQPDPEPEPVPETPQPQSEDVEETTGLLAKDFEFSFNKNGSVDETKIPWADFSKNQRRLLRDRINEINAKSHMPQM